MCYSELEVKLSQVSFTWVSSVQGRLKTKEHLLIPVNLDDNRVLITDYKIIQYVV